MKSAYITKNTFPCGEMCVVAKDDDGVVIFGFRTRDYWGWKNQARDWTPGSHMPVFQANKPAELRA